MCGIAGVFAYGQPAPPVDAAELRRTRDAMALRGPDGEGLWVSRDARVGLAHRRLAVIDLSEGGAQPMASADGRLRITFNGEIYNYRELRGELERKGHAFRSGSDTEVLLHLYADRGKDMVRALRGMYAFALWDERRGVMLLARDPFGIKPLYLADDGRTLRFASQVKALLKGEGADAAPEPAGYVGFLLWGHVPEPFTLYRGIRAFPPGTTMEIEAGGRCTSERFFDVGDTLREAEHSGPGPAVDAAAQVRAVVSDSVRQHLTSDVPVGIFLSAGIDSSALAGMACSQPNPGLKAITLGFHEFEGTSADEVPPAREMAARLGLAHEAHWIARDEFAEELPRILESMDQPSTDGINTWFVSRAAARAGLKVAISGLGGDEVFGGYPSFRQVPRLARWSRLPACVPGLGRLARWLLAPLAKAAGVPKHAGLLEYGGTYPGAYLLRRAHFMPWELEELLDPAMVEAGLERLDTLGCLAATIRGLDHPRSRISALEHAWYMRNQLLRDSDWAGMAHSVEIRLPLVDVELFRALAPSMVRGDGISKRDLAASIEPALPQSVLGRAKTGFVTPVRQWIAKSGEPKAAAPALRAWATQVLPPPPRLFRAWMPHTDAFGGSGGIAKFNRDFLTALSSQPACAGVTATPRVMSGEPGPLPERVKLDAGAARGTLAFLAHVLRAVVRGRYDILVVGHINLAPIALLSSFFRKAPAILIVHGIDAWTPHRSALVRASLRRFRLVVGVSKLTLRRFDAWARVGDDRLRLLPNCVDMSIHGPGPRSAALAAQLGLTGRTVIMTLGRLASEERYKGFDEVLEILPRLSAEIPDLSYLICGEGGDRRRLEHKAETLGVRDRVVFAGFVSEDRKAEHYRLADAFVMPSSGEGFGIVFLEALACGIPVLGSKVDGGREALLDGALGELADPSSPDEVAAGILAALGRGRGNVPELLQHYSYAEFARRLQGITGEIV